MSNVNLKTDFKNGDKLYAEQLNNNFELIKEAFAKGDTSDVVWQDGTTVKFRRYVTTDIEKLPILDGAIIYDIQKGRNYIDYDGKRIQVGSAGNEVIIGEASEITEDTKLIIEQEFIDNIGSEVSSTLGGNEKNKAPSVSLFNENVRNLADFIQLEEGVDLNSILDYGTYRSISSSVSATMSNLPDDINGGFTLYVSSWTSAKDNSIYRRQEIIYADNTYIRRTSNGGSSWTAWNKLVRETDREPVLLWEDTTNGWESGDITLSDAVTNYRFVVIVAEGSGTYIICPIVPKEMTHNQGSTGYVRGVGGYYSGTYNITYHFNATFKYDTPNILTLVGCNNMRHIASGNHNEYTTNTPIRIIGYK